MIYQSKLKGKCKKKLEKILRNKSANDLRDDVGPLFQCFRTDAIFGKFIEIHIRKAILHCYYVTSVTHHRDVVSFFLCNKVNFVSFYANHKIQIDHSTDMCNFSFIRSNRMVHILLAF